MFKQPLCWKEDQRSCVVSTVLERHCIFSILNFLPYNIYSGHVNTPSDTVQFLAGQISFLCIWKIPAPLRLPCPLLANSTKKIPELQFDPMKVSSALTSKVCLFYGCFRQGQVVGSICNRNTKSTLENKDLVAYSYTVGRQFNSNYSSFFEG